MNEPVFHISGENGKIEFSLGEVYDYTSWYETIAVRLNIEINVEGFKAVGDVYTSLGELRVLYWCLTKSISDFTSFTWENMDYDISVFFEYCKLGQCNIIGKYRRTGFQGAELHFEFSSDQSYLANTVHHLGVFLLENNLDIDLSNGHLRNEFERIQNAQTQ